MRDFEYKYKDYQYRIKPWRKLIPAETSWIIYNAYKNNLLVSSDLRSMVWKKILYSVGNIVFPVGTYFLAGAFLRKNTHLLRYLSNQTFMGA